MEESKNMAKTLSGNQENMIMLLKRQLDEGIRAAMAEQITTLEKTFTLKMETLLTQRLLTVVDSQTNHRDRVHDSLQKENMRIQS